MTENFVTQNQEPTLESLFSNYPEVEAAYQQVFARFEECELISHNWEHVLSVTDWSIKLGDEEGLREKELSQLAVIALHHDNGYMIERENGRWDYKEDKHQERSAAQFEVFARKFPTLFDTEESIQRGIHAIIKTNFNEPPSNTFEECLRDADIAPVGFPVESYLKFIEKLRQECASRENWSMHKDALNLSSWGKKQAWFIRDFIKLYTSYAQTHWTVPRQRNIQALQNHYVDQTA